MRLKLQAFIKRALIGGILVILPIVVLALFFRWMYRWVTELIDPVSSLLINEYSLPIVVADALTVVLVLLLFFVVGTVVSTRLGKWIHRRFDGYMVRIAPGYRMIKEIINQFFGDEENSPFKGGQVARVKVFGADVETGMTALVTATHTDGSYTVFVPTGPNPTSGLIYHLPSDQVEILPDIKVDSAMRTVIACGAGSSELFNGKNPANAPGSGGTM